MAQNALIKLCFPILVLLMILFGGLFTLFRVLWAIITHPFTVFKKVQRNGKKTVAEHIIEQRASLATYSGFSPLPIRAWVRGYMKVLMVYYSLIPPIQFES